MIFTGNGIFHERKKNADTFPRPRLKSKIFSVKLFAVNRAFVGPDETENVVRLPVHEMNFRDVAVFHRGGNGSIALGDERENVFALRLADFERVNLRVGVGERDREGDIREESSFGRIAGATGRDGSDESSNRKRDIFFHWEEFVEVFCFRQTKPFRLRERW